MKIRLRTDERGLPHAENAETGERIEYVTSATIEMGPRDVTAVLHIDGPNVDIAIDATIRHMQHLVYDRESTESITHAIAVLVARRNELERL